jgi:asparagine N-glycosylation enzyme membrane subunit Stt3
MIEPASAQLPAIWRGSTYELTLKLYQDEARTKPLNLSAYTVQLQVTGLGVVPVTVNDAEGEVSFSLPWATTNGINTPAQYELWLEQESGAKRYLVLKGTIPVEVG